MIAFLLADLRDWRERRMRKTILLSAILLAAVGLIGTLQPLLLALACAAALIAAGWAEGKVPRSMPSERPDACSFPARPLDLVVGKLLSALILWLGLLLAFSPILAASAIAWGLSGKTIASCLLCWLVAYLAAVAVSFSFDLVFSSSEGFIGLCLYAPWIFASFFVPFLKPSNPFVQAWSILKLEGGGAIYLGICAEALAAAILFAVSILALGSRRRKRLA
jgi:hypothetical protein